MIMAIVRPDKLKEIEDTLKASGFVSLTEFGVRGRGKQKGITIGDMKYEKLPKEFLMMVCKDDEVKPIVEIIERTGRTGNIGDGKIFVLNVEEALTIRTGSRGKEAL